MLHMLAKDGYVALKQEAEDGWRWCHRTSCQKPAGEGGESRGFRRLIGV